MSVEFMKYLRNGLFVVRNEDLKPFWDDRSRPMAPGFFFFFFFFDMLLETSVWDHLTIGCVLVTT